MKLSEWVRGRLNGVPVDEPVIVKSEPVKFEQPERCTKVFITGRQCYLPLGHTGDHRS